MMNEKEIILRIIKGDVKAFSLLVDDYQKLIFHVAKRMIQNDEDVEDVCQEVFIKIYRNIGNFAFKSKLSTWIAKITYLASIDYLKKHKRHLSEELPENLPDDLTDSQTPEDLLEQKDMSQYLNLLIGSLPAPYRLVITLFHLEEFSIQEIESITGIPEGTVKNHLFRARKLLKEKVKQYLKNEHARR
jgi:RNA polymerase sigma-70 factor (ECF subfamily)